MNYDVRKRTMQFSCLEHLVKVHLEQLREEKNFAEADAIRSQLEFAGYTVRYSPDGTVRLSDSGRSPAADFTLRAEKEMESRNGQYQ
ncbi:hypothetical protein SEA_PAULODIABOLI_290 [Microbacterium phage PauloDiaboli]|nr:hypothetical protein SEA_PAULODIABOLI_290 [Microbacterium phage PauloDiaboli]QWY84097.1 hypothetical protein SEA_A3WALLY_290 [Microbacterium phage A3Wally]